MLGRPNKICVSKFIDLMTTSIQELLNDFQRVLVRKFQNNCKQSLIFGHTDTTNLKKVRDWYGKGKGKGKCIQMEALSA